MEGYRISISWLTDRLEPHDAEWSWAVEKLRPMFDQGDIRVAQAGVSSFLRPNCHRLRSWAKLN